jgi:hypothetical protein
MKHNYDMELLPLHLWRNKETDPYKILYHFFDYTSLDMCRQLLQKWFTAAFAETYTWKNEPASLLSFYERLEALLYGCSLLNSDSNSRNSNRKKTTWPEVSALSKSRAERTEVFKYLNAYEVYKPLTVINAFFTTMDLYAWRAELHNWFEAAMGRQTIIHISTTDNVLPVMEQLNKLVEAAYVIYQMHVAENVHRPARRKTGRLTSPK